MLRLNIQILARLSHHTCMLRREAGVGSRFCAFCVVRFVFSVNAVLARGLA